MHYKSGYCFKNEKVTTMFAINKIDEASLVSMAYDFEPQVNLTFFSEHYDWKTFFSNKINVLIQHFFCHREMYKCPSLVHSIQQKM